MERIEKLIQVVFTFAVISASVLFISHSAFAGGVQHYFNGLEAELVGYCPPPGLYYRQFNLFYTANEAKDNSGHDLTLAKDGIALDRVNAYTILPVTKWVTPLKVLGANFYTLLAAPIFVKIDEKVDAALGPGSFIDLTEHRSRVYDVIWANGLGWHQKQGLFHVQAELDIFAPVGMYNPKNLVNIGKNVWTFMSVLGITAFSPWWEGKLEVDVKLMYDFDTTNDDYIISLQRAANIGNLALAGARTHNSPGNAFHTDFAVSYQIYKKLRVGVAGYFYQQVTDDETGFGTIRNNLTRVLGIGPLVWVPYEKWSFATHVQFETAARNAPQGINVNASFSYKFF
jgi:hypothetical protein